MNSARLAPVFDDCNDGKYQDSVHEMAIQLAVVLGTCNGRRLLGRNIQYPVTWSLLPFGCLFSRKSDAR